MVYNLNDLSTLCPVVAQIRLIIPYRVAFCNCPALHVGSMDSGMFASIVGVVEARKHSVANIVDML